MSYQKEITATHNSGMARGLNIPGIRLYGEATKGPKDSIGRRVEYQIAPDQLAAAFVFCAETASDVLLPVLIKALQDRRMGRPANAELRRLLTEALAAVEQEVPA